MSFTYVVVRAMMSRNPQRISVFNAIPIRYFSIQSQEEQAKERRKKCHSLSVIQSVFTSRQSDSQAKPEDKPRT